MKKIDRESFLNNLNLVKSGLSAKDFIEQSSCFVFEKGEVMTFNDEIACRKAIGININGAVPSGFLLEMLEKVPDKELLVREGDGMLEFKGRNKVFGATKDSSIFLPISRVDDPTGKWTKLDKNFTEAVNRVLHCIGTDESKFTLCCLHITPKHVEACNNLEIMRWAVTTKIEENLCVRGTAMRNILALEMKEIAVTKSWIHFRNKSGLTFSLRKHAETFPPVWKKMDMENGHDITIPKGLKDSADRAHVAAVDKSGEPIVKVALSKNVLRITGQGISGYYKEVKKVIYTGPSIEFFIDPKLLEYIAETYNSAKVNNEKLKVTSDEEGARWQYVTVLGKPEDLEEPEEEDEEKPAKRKKLKKKQ